MRAVIQRVDSACVVINNNEERSIDMGLLVFLGVMKDDETQDAQQLAKKICDLRIFTDENDKLNLGLDDIGGNILLISNFTLSADLRKGKRPSFENAAKQDRANELYIYFKELLYERLSKERVKCGEFGAHMDINAKNNGPITLILDTKNKS